MFQISQRLSGEGGLQHDFSLPSPTDSCFGQLVQEIPHCQHHGTGASTCPVLLYVCTCSWFHWSSFLVVPQTSSPLDSVSCCLQWSVISTERGHKLSPKGCFPPGNLTERFHQSCQAAVSPGGRMSDLLSRLGGLKKKYQQHKTWHLLGVRCPPYPCCSALPVCCHRACDCRLTAESQGSLFLI